jgi:hypothetical protein
MPADIYFAATRFRRLLFAPPMSIYHHLPFPTQQARRGSSVAAGASVRQQALQQRGERRESSHADAERAQQR